MKEERKSSTPVLQYNPVTGECPPIAALKTFVDFSESTVTVEQIRGRSHKQEVAVARELYWYFLNKRGVGYRRIAKTADRKRETVLSGIRSARWLVETGHPLTEPYKGFFEMTNV
jgi:hypothetical protein